MRTVNASTFKAQCLAMLDEVAETGEQIVITKRGHPVARIEPMAPPRSLAGSVSFKVSDDELIAPVGETWDANTD